MNTKFGKGFTSLGQKVESFISRDGGLAKGLANCELSVGLATDPAFGVPAHAAQTPVFVGDSALVEGKDITAAAEALLKTQPDKVQVRPVYNDMTGKWKMHFAMPGDEGFDPIAGQLFSPWNITYLSKIWKQPLAYSRAKEMVRTEHCANNPFAEIFTLMLEDYAGWAVIGQTGEWQNQMSNDVNARTGIMSAPIINMMGTYSVTLEEKKRGVWGMAGSSPLSRKQSYLNYVFDMMDAMLIYFGNDETNTLGLLDIGSIKTWKTGQSMKEIFESTSSTTRGSDAYRLLASYINAFLAKADNKFQKIKIAVSPEAYNYLTSMPYSDVYDPQAAMKTFSENYLAGKGPNGTTPTIEFVAEPLLKANSICNPNSFDLMVMTCPEIDGGPNREKQPTNFYATALDKFTFPVIPGMYNDQYKTLRRVAGMIAPIPSAVEVWSGFGVQ